MAHLPHAPLDPPAEYREPLGAIVQRYTRLEYQLSVITRLAARFSKGEQKTQLLSLRAANLHRILLIAARMAPNRSLGTEIETLSRDVVRLGKKRDDYVHSLYGWWSDDPTKSPARFRVENRKPPEDWVAHPVSRQELTDFATEIQTHIDRAQKLTRKMKR